MTYDYMGRRCEYKETVSGTLTRHERYLCRKYLQVAALDMLNSADVKHTIAWDPTEPAATRPLALQVGANAYFYSFDQVKNVTELFDSAGTIAETYDYSPFGQITSALSVASNPLTFSSEVQDSTLGLQYYNYRHLNTLDGRWINRDLIEEEGGINLYGMVENNGMTKVDINGNFSIEQLRNHIIIPRMQRTRAAKIKCTPNANTVNLHYFIAGTSRSEWVFAQSVWPDRRPGGPINSTYYWWDCFSGGDEARAIGNGAKKSEWGWTRGKKNYAKQARAWGGGGWHVQAFDFSDSTAIAIASIVVYEICQDGCLVTDYRESNPLEYHWHYWSQKWHRNYQ